MDRVDDIEDNSELRRGIPVAHHIYGTPQTINTANYVYFLAMQELIKLEGSGREVIGLVTGSSILDPFVIPVLVIDAFAKVTSISYHLSPRSP